MLEREKHLTELKADIQVGIAYENPPAATRVAQILMQSRTATGRACAGAAQFSGKELHHLLPRCRRACGDYPNFECGTRH